MDVQNLSVIIGASLGQQKARVELAGYRLAVAESRFSSKEQLVDFMASLTSGVSDTSVMAQQELAVDIKEIKDASSPIRNSDDVYYMLNVDPTHEMATLVSATRAYQSVVRAFNVSTELNRTALKLGESNS